MYREYELVYHERQIVILYEDFTWQDEDMLQQLVTLLSHKFNICVKEEWDETVTHLIVKTSRNNICQNRSIMYMYALLSHCFIINTQWIQECLNTGYLVPEASLKLCFLYSQSQLNNFYVLSQIFSDELYGKRHER